MSSWSPPFSAVVVVALGLSQAVAAESPILEFRLNSSEMPGESTGTTPASLEEISGIAFVSDDGLGTSGQPGDRAVDYTDATRMGGTESSPGSGKAVFVPMSELPRTLESFTIQGWYKTLGEHPGNYARLLDCPRMGILLAPEGLQFSLYPGAMGQSLAVCDEDLFYQEGKWVFWAISYDGVGTANQVRFYYGSEDEDVREVGAFTVPGGVVRHSGNGSLVWGNREAGDRPLQGLMDNLRFWGAEQGEGGVLGLDDLEAVRKGDLAL